jgi:O-antigen/teichoic acid export membrane protein
MKDLKNKTLRGGVARMCTLGSGFLIRILSIMILARLLSPRDFGLVGMVTAFTGILGMLRDFGLSSASVQREKVTQEQISTLFWINLAFGAALSILTLAMAPLIARFYHEPHLFGVTVALSFGVFFNAAGVQHVAVLQRRMRFTTLAVINTLGIVVGTAIAIVAAWAGFGYWSLVMLSDIAPLISTIGYWVATSWIPGLPRRRTGVRSMMRFGGTVTLQGFLIYIANNFEKVLLGRYWGADAIGIYGRAYRLNNIPTDNLNSTAGEVAFAALSRLQNEPARLKSYFLKGYSLILSLTLPITIASALFAPDIILTLLGPKWKDAISIFRLLSPTILVFAVVNPMGWLLCSIGKVDRLLKMSLVITPIMIVSYLLAIPYGPNGVAFTYSLLMLLWMFPTIAWGLQGTVISFWDMVFAVRSPLVSSIVAAGLAFAFRFLYGHALSDWPRLILEGTIMLAAYLGMLLYVTGEKEFYMDILRGLKGSSSAEEKESLVSA